MSESFAQLLEESFANQKIKTGAILTGVVVGVNADMVIVNAGLKSEAVIPADQFFNERGELEVKVGDRVLFYHSNEGLAIVGIAEVVKEAYQDPTTSDERWVVVDLAPVEQLANPVGKECRHAEVQDFFFALVLQDENVTGLHERSLTRVVDRFGQVNFDCDLAIAGGLTQDVQHSWRHHTAHASST